MRKLAVGTALAALVFPAPAFGHAGLVHQSPGLQQRLKRSPPLVILRYDEHVIVSDDSIVVRSARGRLVSAPAFQPSDRRVVETRLRPLRRGAYTIRWHVLSEDGHVVSGVATFGVRYPAPPPTEAYGASGPTTTEHVIRWAYFFALALAVGGLGFRLLVLPRGAPVPRRLERRFFLLTGIGIVAVLELGITAFILRAEDALQLPFGRLLYGDLTPIASGTRFGAAFIAMTLGFALVSALIFLSWLFDLRALLWPAFLIGLGFASGLSLSGHSAAEAGSTVFSSLADWAHLAAALLWIGGLVQLAFVVWPAAPELRREAFVRFSRLATGLIGVILVAGVYLSIARLPHLHDLWTAGYGHVLLVKLALVALALSWGAFHHFVARPAVERGRSFSLLPRSLVGESAVGVAILLVAAVLVDSKPPPRTPPPAPVAAQR
jgi:copper transport protein